jgi:hypothetical protein
MRAHAPVSCQRRSRSQAVVHATVPGGRSSSRRRWRAGTGSPRGSAGRRPAAVLSLRAVRAGPRRRAPTARGGEASRSCQSCIGFLSCSQASRSILRGTRRRDIPSSWRWNLALFLVGGSGISVQSEKQQRQCGTGGKAQNERAWDHATQRASRMAAMIRPAAVSAAFLRASNGLISVAVIGRLLAKEGE